MTPRKWGYWSSCVIDLLDWAACVPCFVLQNKASVLEEMDFIEACRVFISSNLLIIPLTASILLVLSLWGFSFYRAYPCVPARSLPSVSFFRLVVDTIKFKGQSHLQFDKYYREFGRNFSMIFFGKLSVVVVNEPAMLKDIFVKEFQSFHDRPAFVSLFEPFDSMMAVASGKTWHRIRTTISPAFSAHKMKLMIPLMNKSCDLLEKKLDQVAGTGETIDIYKYFQALTMESILAVFFGMESNAQNDYNDPAFKAARDCFQLGTFQRIILSLAIFIPGGSLILKYFPSVVMGHFSSLMSLTKKIIEAKKNGSLVGWNKDFLDMMLSKTELQDDPSNNSRLSENEVIAQSFAFLIAGYDTTSNVLSIVSHHLATNPDVQEKLQKEIDEVWSEDDQPPSYEVVQSLPYLDMVISETLRLYPPGFIVSRKCTSDCVIKGLAIKKGEVIISLPYSLHRDPHFFPGPDRFDPERFTAEAKTSRDPYTYFHFGHGPRNCIGMRFAQMEMKLTLVRIMKRFTIVVAPETKIPPVIRVSSILGCTDGIKLRIENR